MTSISIQADLKPLHRALRDIGHKQVPFATALGLTKIAQAVQADERIQVDKTFDKATPFTENAFAVLPAKKIAPIAVVFAKDVQAQYLAPYVVGGDRSLGSKKGMLVPIGAATNQYGNLSKGTLARLKARPNVFVGSVRTRGGKVINGIWQRQPAPKSGRRSKSGNGQSKSSLKLLIEFEDTTPVRKRLDFEGRARSTIQRVAAREMSAALTKALATARR